MTRHHVAAAAAIVMLALGTAGPAAASVVFLDTGSSGTYSTGVEFKANASVTSTLGICGACGNPGQAIDFEVTLNQNQPLAYYGVFLNNSFVYSPLLQGAITSIDTSADKNFLVNRTVNYNNNYRLVIKQDGNYFAAIVPGPTLIGPGSTGFVNFAAAGLLPANFQEIDPATGQIIAGTPNFAGNPITFGVAQSLGSAGIANTTVSAIYDNVRIAVNVPEPGTLGLLATALAAVGALRRRSTRPI